MNLSDKVFTEHQIKFHEENSDYIEFHEYYNLDTSFKKNFELKNKVFKISFGNLYYHLNINSYDLVSIDVSRKIKESLINHFEFLIPDLKRLKSIRKVWFVKEDYDKLAFFLTKNHLKEEISFSCVLMSFMLNYGFTKLVDQNSFEYQLQKIYTLLNVMFVANSPDGVYAKNGEYDIESINIGFVKKSDVRVKEKVILSKLKLESNERKFNAIQFEKFQRSLKKSFISVVKENLNQIQLKSQENTNKKIASAFFNFIKGKYPKIEDTSICKVFIYLFIHSNNDLIDPKYEELKESLRIDINVKKVMKWMKS